jgi:N utilization substance protein B
VSTAGPRRRAREAALQVLYAADAAHRLEPEMVERVHAELVVEFQLAQRARERSLEIAAGVACNLKRIDEEISSASQRWKLYRIAAVERNILRIGTFELLFEPETPTEVILDEAVEIARRFAGDAAPSFVNGVLDEIAKVRTRGSDRAPEEPAR